MKDAIILFEVQKKYKRKSPKILKAKTGRMMFTSKCAVQSSKKLRFYKKQEPSELLHNLTGIELPILIDLPIPNILL